MANKYLARGDAPFGDEVWSKLDEVVVSTARSQLSGRRLLEVEGPYGLAVKSIPLHDELISEGDVTLVSSAVIPVPLIEAGFTLTARDLANFEKTGFSLHIEHIATAALKMAAAEDDLIFWGNADMGLHGLLNAPGTHKVKLGTWQEIGTAANDVIQGLNALDKAGFHGPYLLALAPELYNMLFRLYPQGYQTELQHVETAVGSHVIKAPGIKKGGVLLAAGKQFASIIVGQDMIAAFIGPAEHELEFKITESVAPRIRLASAVCVLQA